MVAALAVPAKAIRPSAAADVVVKMRVKFEYPSLSVSVWQALNAAMPLENWGNALQEKGRNHVLFSWFTFWVNKYSDGGISWNHPEGAALCGIFLGDEAGTGSRGFGPAPRQANPANRREATAAKKMAAPRGARPS
jgi:hypothetical protein